MRLSLPLLCAVTAVLLAPVHELRAQVSGEVRGRITEAGTGRPVADARIEMEGVSTSARTNADGTYLVRSLEPRAYVVRVRALGFVERALDVTVQNARVTQLDVVLQAMAPVLERMVVAAQRDSIAPNATTFTRATIEASGQRDLGDLLQTTPGVVITRSGGPGQPARVSIRGSSSNQVLILLDGVPLNSAISGSADLSTIPLENIERVTVLTGAQSARYGPRAMAGVIEIVTRRSRHERSALVRGGALGELGVAGTLGTSVHRANGTRSASLGVDHRSVQGDFSYPIPAVRGGGRADRLNADATTTQVVGSAGLEVGHRQFTVRGTYGSTDRGMAGTIVQPSLSGRQQFSRLNGGVTAQWSPSRWVIASAADVTRERGMYTDPTPPFGQPLADTVTANGLTVTSSATAAWRLMTTSAGIDVRHIALASNNLAANAPDGQTLAGAWF
ncbi:MAG TPA: TonB-dependent receptor plug domain-containing protein, partial [Gemmatimonas sp.]|uniref:TonB-dependent receptor n=1 Tax=Gemmatimonas sp. TaxID=1962908 RepID=UPI002ED9482D